MRITLTHYSCLSIALMMIPGLTNAEPHAPPKGTPSAITLRATSALPDAAIEFIAKNGLPTAAILPAGATPESLITAACGSNTNRYQSLFIASNTHLTFLPSNKSRRVTLPACAKWRWKAQVLVRDDDTIESLLDREVGRKPDDILEPCSSLSSSKKRCNKSFLQLIRIDNPSLQTGTLKPGSRIQLPVVSQWATIRLDPIVWPDPLQFSVALTKIASTVPGSSIITNRPAASIHLINPVEDTNLGVQAPACRDPKDLSTHSWPFLPSSVVNVLMRDAAFNKDTIQRATIAILDTGLAGLGTPNFPTQWFVSNPRATLGALTPPAGRLYAGDVYGVSIWVQTGAISPNLKYDWPYHGTEVADIALGGFPIRRQYNDLAKYVGLKIVNIVSSRNVDDPKIEESDILAGIRYADDQGAAVANLSVTSSDDLEELKSTLVLRPRLLLVAAAGNETSDITYVKAFPASYGGIGPLGANVITVAAVDGDYHLSLFSNYSSSFVDIGAPGCAIPFHSSSGDDAGISGTSFAAPLVSFAAALLSHFGLIKPQEVKNRLYASSNYQPGLKVRSEGILNIPKALSIYDDVVETKEGLGFGTVTFEKDQTFCDGSIDALDVLKINSTDGGAQLRIGFYDANGVIAFQKCDVPESAGISFRSNATNTSRPIKWSDITDFVARLPGQPVRGGGPG